MDKQNYNLKALEVQVIREHFSELMEKLTERLEGKIIKRKRVLKSLSQLVTGLCLYFVDQLSFQRLSDVMALQYGVKMSDIAWRKQFLKAAPILWAEVKRIQAEETYPADKETEKILGCSPAYALDATNFSVQGGKTSANRVHTLYSLTQHRCTFAEITDLHGGERLQRFPFQAGALYFADRAYGRTSQLAYAMEKKANFVIRLAPHLVRLFTSPECREVLSFQTLMEKDAFSTPCYFKCKNRVYCVRLVGAKLPQEKQEAAVKRMHCKAKCKQRKVSSWSVEAAKWLILVTTLPDSISDSEMIQAYRLRWQIELYFKRMKSLLNFRKIRRSSPAFGHHIVSLWMVVAFLLSSLQLLILLLSNFSISDFNAFSLARSFFS